MLIMNTRTENLGMNKKRSTTMVSVAQDKKRL